MLAERQILILLGLIFTFSFYHTLLDNFKPKISPQSHQQQQRWRHFWGKNLFSVYAVKICFHAFYFNVYISMIMMLSSVSHSRLLATQGHAAAALTLNWSEEKVVQ